MIRRLRSWLAYRRFQSRCRRAEALAVSTQAIGRIRRHRTATLHSALAGGSK